jgi:hypothetical protein
VHEAHLDNVVGKPDRAEGEENTDQRNREIMTVFRGTVPHINLVVFIGYAPLGRIEL